MNPPDAPLNRRFSKYSTLALDYDGTIADEGVLDIGVRQAIHNARSHGIRVLIVTGRILEDLQGVAGDLHFVDAVVAENGAILVIPGSSVHRVLAPVVPSKLIDALRATNIPFRSGTCVIESDATFAPCISQVIQRVEAPYNLIFNRTRVMVLPAGISKASGLRQALRELRLPRQTTLAIGDGENDEDLFKAAGFGIAVSWGTADLKASANEVLEGTGPAAVATYIQQNVIPV